MGDYKQFTMSMYMSSEYLYKAKAEYYMEKVFERDAEIIVLEGRILKMIHANRQRSISLTLDEVDAIIEGGGEGC